MRTPADGVSTGDLVAAASSGEREGKHMTRADMIKAILDDMVGESEKARHMIERRWKGWLNRQPKAELEQIMKNRNIRKQEEGNE